MKRPLRHINALYAHLYASFYPPARIWYVKYRSAHRGDRSRETRMSIHATFVGCSARRCRNVSEHGRARIFSVKAR